MEYRAGCDLTPSSGEAEARDTLNTVLVCLSLLLFTLLLSCRAARLRRESPVCALRRRGVSGDRRPAPRRWRTGPAAAGLLFQAGAGDLEKRAGSRRSRRLLRQDQCLGLPSGTGGRAAAVLGPDRHPTPGSGFRRGAGAGERMKTGRAPLSRFFYVFSGNQRDRICATPSSSLEGAVRSAATSVSGAPFAMATPIPASRRRLRSLVPSPKAAASRGIDPQTAAQGAQSFSLRGVRGVELQVGGHGDGLDQIWERQLALLHHLGPQGQIGEIGLELLGRSRLRPAPPPSGHPPPRGCA